jgi:hypothetical protein
MNVHEKFVNFCKEEGGDFEYEILAAQLFNIPIEQVNEQQIFAALAVKFGYKYYEEYIYFLPKENPDL